MSAILNMAPHNFDEMIAGSGAYGVIIKEIFYKVYLQMFKGVRPEPTMPRFWTVGSYLYEIEETLSMHAFFTGRRDLSSEGKYGTGVDMMWQFVMMSKSVLISSMGGPLHRQSLEHDAIAQRMCFLYEHMLAEFVSKRGRYSRHRLARQAMRSVATKLAVHHRRVS